MIESIKKLLKSCYIGRSVYPVLNRIYRLYSVPARRRQLQKNGYVLLKEIFEISKTERLGLFPLYGSLLGFERDGGFIPWDDDIDLGFVDEEDSVRKVAEVLMKKHSFSFYHGHKYHERIAEFTLKHKNITIDFFPLHKEDDSLMAKAFYWRDDIKYDKEEANSAYYMRHPLIPSLMPMVIHGVEIEVPANKDEIMIAEFGEKWRIPDPNFSEMMLPSFVNKDDFGYAINEMEFWEILNNNYSI